MVCWVDPYTPLMIMVGRSIQFLGVTSDVREIAIVIGGWVSGVGQAVIK
jgi:hypothetical protein